jgi:hypothetical protein
MIKRPIDVYREEKSERDAALNTERVKAIRTRRMQNELYLAKARELLIEKDLVEKQAAYLVIAMRQKILTIPQTYARRILGLDDASQASKILKEMAVTILNEIKDLPQKVVDPRWMDEVEREDNA